MNTVELQSLVESLIVRLEEAENKAGNKMFEVVSMKDYLLGIGKTWHDFDEQKVRDNLSSVWVARNGTNELPVPFPADYFA